jgi:predicted RNA-binding Zn-ribbon protein involved in translation (DUF1610 family)
LRRRHRRDIMLGLRFSATQPSGSPNSGPRKSLKDASDEERARQRKAAMEHLIFVCPTTGREVDSGVESEISTLLRIRQQTVRMRCPACGEWHEWSVRDAFLARAA